MSRESWERNSDVQSEYFANENRRLHIEPENDYWHSETGQYLIRYNHERNEEINRRNAEILGNLKSFYSSRNGIILSLIVSIMVCILTSTVSVLGFILWNLVLFFPVVGYYRMFAKTKVRPEITSQETMIRLSARDKAYGR